MTHYQFKLILEKIRNNIDCTVFENNHHGRIGSMRSQWPSGHIEIKAYGDDISVMITPLGSSATTGKISHPGGIRFLNVSWWRWRSLCKDAEKENRRRAKIDKLNQQKWETEQMDRAIVQTFPEIIEDEIFGDE